jgi:methylenetetrahydrofolate dehydrogenase (NADP+)/methenyltetrahydrofolate cyclohydrolase
MLLDGRLVARELLAETAAVASQIRDVGITPTLAFVLVGEHPESGAYTKMIRLQCQRVGIRLALIQLPESASTEQLVSEVARLGGDPKFHGIVIQHPVPVAIDKRAAFEAIPLGKDIDGVSSAALGRLVLGMPAFGACTPKAIMRLMTAYDVPLDGANAVVIGRSPILGRPLASMLINAHATVTLCHSRTRNLREIAQTADILIAAVGSPRFVRGDWIRPGATVIDAGYNEGNVGDVDFEAAAATAARITPVPGGVGPITVATLLEQLALAAYEETAGPRIHP